MNDDRQPTHDEIWDDSALVDSWNQALNEYKKYHSIHAGGGAVLGFSDSDQQETSVGRDAKPKTEAGDEPIGNEGAPPQRKSDETRTGTRRNEAPQDAKKVQGRSNNLPGPASETDTAHGPGAGLPMMGPQTLLGSVQDEDLKKLLMSWYYAGYYTGLHEGKRQAEQAGRR